MTDEYVEEIRKIREKQYEETKDMSFEEQLEYTRIRSEQIEQRIAEYRSTRAPENQTKTPRT